MYFECGRLLTHPDWFVRSCVLGTVIKRKNGLAFGIGLMSKENIGWCAGQVWSARTASKVLKERDFQVKQKGG